MTKTTDRRKVELMLLVLTQFVVLCGLGLVFWGSGRRRRCRRRW